MAKREDEPDSADLKEKGRKDGGNEEEERIGPFRSWRGLYITVVAYTAALVIILYLATRLLDTSAQ